MQKASELVNHARKFSLSRFWRQMPEQTLRQHHKPRSFTYHMVAIVAKLIALRGSDGIREFTALAEIFHLGKSVRCRLLDILREVKRDPLPVEYHAKSIGSIYSDTQEKRKKTMRSLVRLAYSSSRFISRHEYQFLRSISSELGLSDRFFHHLCEFYEIEIPQNDPYAVLGVSRFTSAREVKHRYYQLVREYHPDHAYQKGYATGQAEIYSQKLAEINQAYAHITA
jgi:DnaJ like chaperone protein